MPQLNTHLNRRSLGRWIGPCSHDRWFLSFGRYWHKQIRWLYRSCSGKHGKKHRRRGRHKTFQNPMHWNKCITFLSSSGHQSISTASLLPSIQWNKQEWGQKSMEERSGGLEHPWKGAERKDGGIEKWGVSPSFTSFITTWGSGDWRKDERSVCDTSGVIMFHGIGLLTIPSLSEHGEGGSWALFSIASVLYKGGFPLAISNLNAK